MLFASYVFSYANHQGIERVRCIFKSVYSLNNIPYRIVVSHDTIDNSFYAHADRYIGFRVRASKYFLTGTTLHIGDVYELPAKLVHRRATKLQARAALSLSFPYAWLFKRIHVSVHTRNCMHRRKIDPAQATEGRIFSVGGRITEL